MRLSWKLVLAARAVDTGVLGAEWSDAGRDRRLAGACSSGTVACVYGFVEGTGETETCATACDGACCVGQAACNKFTGHVCKDSVSCTGPYACFDADIGYVVQGCNGDRACYAAARTESGYIKEVINGCQGPKACFYAANTGTIGAIKNACNAEKTCYMAAAYGAVISPGFFDCCNEVDECAYAESLPESCPAAVPSATATPSEVPTLALTDTPTATPTEVPSDALTGPPTGCVPHLVEDSDNCTKPLTFDECGEAAISLGYKWISNPINPAKKIDHIPGGCFAKKNTRKDEIIKMRYNSHTDIGTNCGKDTRGGNFTKLCVCCA